MSKHIKDYSFDSWIPEDVQQQLIKFWGSFGRTSKDWLDCAKREESEHCYYVEASGFRHPPHGARAEYILRNYRCSGETKFIKGRYIHMWNNMGRLITRDSVVCVSTCDRWVRIYE
jgi:hypothetical protein